MLRSFLFVPADSPRKLTRGRASPADALILDLEDAVASEHLAAARRALVEFLEQETDRSRQQLWVRINPLRSQWALADLAAVMPGRPDGIVLPKPDSMEEVSVLDHYLSALEVREGQTAGTTRILAIATESPRALLNLASYSPGNRRLYGLTWGAEDLSAAVGASRKRKPDGTYDDLYRLARALCLAAARGAGVVPVDGVYPEFRDLEGLEREAVEARQLGFSAKVAIHPDQVEVLHRAFTPSPQEVDHARRVVAAFESQPDAGTVGLDGQMLDKPHLEQARRILDLAAHLSS